LPAAADTPAILEIKPLKTLTGPQIAALAQTLEQSGRFSFVSVNHQLLERNVDASYKAKNLALVFLLLAFVTSGVICLTIVRREIFRSNSDTVNLLRQLGATPITIARPYIYRAALITLAAGLVVTGLFTLFNKIVQQYVDISSYASIFMDSIPIGYLVLLVLVSVTTACFAAATALHSFFSYINHIVKKLKSNYSGFRHKSFAEN